MLPHEAKKADLNFSLLGRSAHPSKCFFALINKQMIDWKAFICQSPAWFTLQKTSVADLRTFFSLCPVLKTPVI
jgi:hypothetical protein